MANTERQRQKKLAKQRTKKNRQRRELSRKKNELASLAGRMRAISHCPVAVSCFGAGAYEPNGMVTAYFGRTMHDGQIMLTVWLLDNACLGVKDAFERVVTKSELSDFLRKCEANEELIHAEPSSVLALIEQSLEFASTNGFNPISIVSKLLPIFGDVDWTECHDEFVFGGPDGKPSYIRGPRDSRERVAKILSILEENLGEGNYYFTIALGPDDDLSSFADLVVEDEEEFVDEDLESERLVW